MAANPKLKLPTDVTTRLFRAVVDRLRTDPMLSAHVKTFKSWEGAPTDKDPPSWAQGPFLRMSATVQGEKWFTPNNQVGTLLIHFDAYVPSLCIDDTLNLWGAIRNAIYNPNNRESWTAFSSRLATDLGARTGLIELIQPLTPQGDPDNGVTHAAGTISIEYYVYAAS